MKKSVKILSAVMAVVLIFACGVGATLAYLQKTTGPVTNTFAAKDLITDPSDFVLKEHKVERKDNGVYDYVSPKEEVDGNQYDRVVPGAELPKDPFVRVKNVEDAYLYIEVVGTLPEGMSFTINDTLWTKMPDAKAEHNGVVYACKANKGGFNEYVLPALLAKNPTPYSFDLSATNIVTVSDTFEPGLAGQNATLTFYAYLAQASNFTYQSAWDTMFDTAKKTV